MPGAEWFTPIASQRIKEHFWKKLEDTTPKAPPLDLKQTLSYYNNEVQHHDIQQYDLFFAYTKTFPLWDIRKCKDNAGFIPEIRENIFQQEKDKPFPVVTSMMYGRPCRVFYDPPEGTYRRQDAMKGFTRRFGVFLPKERQPT